MSLIITRKPVALRPPSTPTSERAAKTPHPSDGDASAETNEDQKKAFPVIGKDELVNVESSIKEDEVCPDLDEQIENLQLETGHGEPLPSLTDVVISEEFATVGGAEVQARKPSKVKSAYGEVKHFAGGLISHPYEATKHYSVLRHSHGLVFYKGPTTSVSFTIFSDQPLPADRTLSLQRRGFSGKMGMRVGAALGNRTAWIDVTPSIDATADQLPKADERAWQRDVAKFLKKAKNTKNLCNHVPYETNVVRIPHAAEDGYFRVVLCAGRNVLCPSPVFRYASSSLDPSTLRGASLTTLPLELGIRIGSLVAKHTANAAACGAIQPAIDTMQNITQSNSLTQWVATTAYTTSGAADKVDGTVESVNQQYEAKRKLEFRPAAGDGVGGAQLVGADEGPESPYPIRFSGSVAQSPDESRLRLGVPAASLVDVPEDTLLRISGVYMGWVSFLRTKKCDPELTPTDLYDVWYKTVIMVVPKRDNQPTVVQQKHVFVFLLPDFGEAVLFESRMDVVLMAFIHDHDTPECVASSDRELQQAQILSDIVTTQLSLSRPAWSPEAVLERITSKSSGRSFTERIADARQTGQKRIDKVPFHRLGVRTHSMGLKDQLIGAGGICVKR